MLCEFFHIIAIIP